MPQRFLRPGITTSQKFNSIDWIAQSFFLRLLTLVDDYGRYESNLMILRSHAFPLGGPDGSDIDLQTIANICKQLFQSDLVDFYEVDGKGYLQIKKWIEKPRSVSKYPSQNKPKQLEFTELEKIDELPCKQLLTIENKCLSPSPSPSPSPSSIYCPSGAEIEIYEAYPRKAQRSFALKAISKALKEIPFEQLLAKTKAYAEIAKSIEPRFIPYPASWFNKGGYLDDIGAQKGQIHRPANPRIEGTCNNPSDYSEVPIANRGIRSGT